MAFSGTGAGTAGDPYIITDINELNEIRDYLTAYFELGNNIDASETSGWNGGAGWIPVDDFSGQFDGKGYTINGLFINRPTELYVAFFGRNSGGAGAPTFKNTILTNIDFTGLNQVAGFCARGDEGYTATDCGVEGSITAKTVNNTCGGFAATLAVLNGDIDIDRCYFNGDITVEAGGGLIGGFAGNIQNKFSDVTILPSVDKCYAKGTITVSDGVVGGFLGRGDSSVDGGNYTIADCYAQVDISGTGLSRCAGFIGAASHTVIRLNRCWAEGTLATATTTGGFSTGDGDAVASDCFWDTTVSSEASSSEGTGKTTAQMQTQSTFTNYNFTSTWTMGTDRYLNYPVLQWEITETTFVFDLSNPSLGEAWTEFKGLDIKQAVILSRGDVDGNVNLFLTDDNSINQYPGSNYTAKEAFVTTKEFAYDIVVLQKFRLEFEGGTPEILTIVESQDSDNPDNKKYQTFTNLTTDVWQTVPPAYARGERVTFKIADAETLQSLIFRAKVKGV